MSRSEKRLHDSLGYLVSRASRIVLKLINQEFMSRGYNLTWGQFDILAHLLVKDGQNQQQLAGTLYKDKTTMTRLIKSVEALKLVRRVSNKKDKREKLVYLTASGRKIMEEITGITQGVLRKVQKGIDPAELDICKRVLRRVHETLSEELT